MRRHAALLLAAVAVAASCANGNMLATSSSGATGGSHGHGGAGGGTGGAGATATSSTSTGGAGTTASTGTTGGAGTTSSTGGSGGAIPPCPLGCSPDQHTVVDCHDQVVTTCTGTQGCDPASWTCADGCATAVKNQAAIGCEYYATFMDQVLPDACFAAIVANTWWSPAHVQVSYQGNPLDVASFTRLPSGSGPALTYAPYDPVAGLPPGEVAILFLSGSPTGPVPCPAPSAVPTGVMQQTTTIADAFHVTTDVPVVAYQINPYGGGSAETTGASLLLPTSVWGKNYIAVDVAATDYYHPSLNIVAMEDGTMVTMKPTAAVIGGGGIPPVQAGQHLQIMLNQGQHAQISQNVELTGSIVQSNKPVGFMAGHECERYPTGNAFCDHSEQMIPPVQAMGSEYVGVAYRPRIALETSVTWRLVGAVDFTALTWTPDVGGPGALNAGQVVELDTGTPFVVKSQDENHPFMLFTYMSGNQLLPGLDGIGDPDFVISVPPAQYLSRYVFFADPTYPETNLVLVRAASPLDMTFKDVTLDCAGAVGGWQPLGAYEWTRVDLSTGDFKMVGGCSTGAHVISSAAPFGLWVWGWGSPNTTTLTRDVSYGYPAGMKVQAINTVVAAP